MMSNAIVEALKEKKPLTLKEEEQSILEARVQQLESWVQIAFSFARIKEHKKYREAGFESFYAYVDAGRLPYSRPHVKRLLAEWQIRIVISEIENAQGLTKAPPGALMKWPENAVRPLAKKELTDNKRALKKVIRQIVKHCKKHNEKPTNRLVKEFVDVELGVARRRTEKQLKSADLGSNLQRLTGELKQARTVLSAVPKEEWAKLTSSSDDDYFAVRELRQVCSSLLRMLPEQ